MNSSADLQAQPPLFTHVHVALGNAKAMPAPGRDEHKRILTEADASEADIQRYFQARELAAELAKLAQGDAAKVYKTYQAQCGDQREVALAGKLLGALGALAETSACLPEAVFALLSGSGGVSATQLVTRSRAELSAVLAHAVETGQVAAWPASGTGSLPRLVDRLAALRDALNLSLAPDAHRLGSTILLADPRLSKVSALFDHGLASGGFAGIEAIRLNRDEAARLGAVQKLAAAADNDMPLVAAFMAQHAGLKGKDRLAPGQGRAIDLAALIAAAVAAPAAHWDKLAASVAPDAAEAVGATVAAKIKLAEPRAALMNQLAAAPAGAFRTTATLLDRHSDFDPLKQSAESYFAGNKRVSREQIEEVKTFQRLAKIAPAGDGQVAMAAAMLNAGFTSAGQILQMGQIDFTQAMTASTAFAIVDIRAIYCRVREVSDLRAEMQIRLNHSGVRTIDEWQAVQMDINSLAFGVEAADGPVNPPNLAEMFGSFDACACSECQSVHSPAAYLHNLLHWMKSDVAGAWPTLEARRPDIKHLKLSCSNTHRLLPYIDLANKLLCARIEGAALPVETTWEEPALRLQPEFRYRRAERDLATERFFPITLPYDRSRAEGEAALAAAGVAVHEAMELFLPADRSTWSMLPNDPSTEHLRASLGLNAWAMDNFLLQAPVPPPGKTFWTAFTGGSTAPGTSVGKAMTALGLEFGPLADLLALDFVRRDKVGKAIFAYDSIVFSDDDCSYDAATFALVAGDTPPNNQIGEELCLNALRLMRLARDTGYSAAQLDGWLTRYVAMTGGDAEITAEFLQFLSTARRIEAQTNVPVQQTIGFVELLASTSPETEANIDTFVDLYGMRSNADIKRCFALYPAQMRPTDWGIDALAARIGHLQTLFGSVVDTAKIPAAIPPLSLTIVGSELALDTAPVFQAVRTALEAHMDAMLVSTGTITGLGPPREGPLDRALLGDAILDTVAHSMGIDKALVQQVYIARADIWFDLCHVAEKSLYPAAIPDLEPFMLQLWQTATRQWLDRTIDACQCSAPLKAAVIDFAFPPSGPGHPIMSDDLALRLARLRSLAKAYRIREKLLAGALCEEFDPGLVPALADSWAKVAGQPWPQDELACLEQALRLHALMTETGASMGLLAGPDGIFAAPHLPVWGDFALPIDADDNAGRLTKAMAAAHMGNGRVMTILNDSMDDVRMAFRDALVAYTLRQDPDRFDGMEDIYKELLLDPGMQPCMMTSQLVSATGSLQLLMHRAMLNLEPGIAPSADDKEEFEWRKSYRIWEANVKVLLYPENWIEPDLRLDPTPLFENAAAALSQDELTEAHCETVLYDYLSGLDKIARLDIRAFYRDGETLHVFGRSWNAPYEYFYRQRTDAKVWTAWDKIDIDIEGDHLIPVIFHRRLSLFWPIFVEKEHRDIKIEVNGETRGAPYLEIRMAYTTFEHGRWREKKLLGPVLEAGTFSGPGVALNIRRKLGADKKIARFEDMPNPQWVPGAPPWHQSMFPRFIPTAVSNETFTSTLVLTYDANDGASYTDYAKVDLDRRSFFFWASEDDGGNLSINIRRGYSPEWESRHDGYTELGYEDGFRIDACGASGRLFPAMFPGNEPRIVARPYRTVPNAQNMVEGFDRPDSPKPNPLRPLYVKTEFTHAPGSFPILIKAPTGYELTYPQKKDAMWTEPFFMADSLHTHFFERRSTCTVQGGPAGIHIVRQSQRYDVALHEHPYSCLMIANFNRWGIDGLFAVKANPDGLRRQAMAAPLYFKQDYDPGNLGRINLPLPVQNFDFAHGGAYSAYNWELFFHLPTLIARQLKTEGRHKEAIRWLSLIFDPTSREALGTRRVWRFNPFMTASTETSIAAMVKLLSQGSADPVQEKLRASVEAQIRAWRDTPFEPHKIAEIRHSAYMLWCVLEYVDVLIEWGDALFRQDSMESINEATNLYLLANEILGKRPTVVDKGSSVQTKSFKELLTVSSGADWSDDLEAHLTAYGIANDCKTDDNGCRPSIAGSLFPGQYFCVPPNPKLPEYWDRVEDRLFKIRHCRNLAGEQRSLALFQPPIDPALLVRARAAGLSIEDVLAGLAEAQLPYRFHYLLGKAQDFTAEVKALGGQLLSAIEKKDAEELSQIRQTHELNIQRATRNLKLMSLAEAKEGLAALQHSLKGAEITLANYEGRSYTNPREEEAIAKTKKSDNLIVAEQTAQMVASILRIIPDFYVGVPPQVKVGGTALGGVAAIVAQSFGMMGSIARSQAAASATFASYDRRAEEWRLQIDTTRERLKELERQIISAEIRIQTAEKDLEVFDQQVENSKEIYDYMRSKFSNEQLYGWMAGQLKTFHRGAYALASGMARQAQMAYKRELGDGTIVPPDVLTADHWDSGRAGLLAGEKLGFELKKLDNAFARERATLTIYELSRTVSLRRLDPVQLFALKAGNAAQISLPEWLFQTSHDGAKLKDMRLKAVSISLPCTVGPNTRVPLRVRLLNLPPSSPAQRTIITSTAMADSGRFDPNPNGEIYLPFENEPVVSTWEITLPDSLEFDPATISDLIFNIRYTAQPDSDSGVGSQQTASPAEGSFGVSLRQDNYDGWLQLHRNLEANSATPVAWDTYFTDAVVTAATPYVYSSWAADPIAYYAICSTSEGVAAHPVDPTGLDTGLNVVLGKLKHTIVIVHDNVSNTVHDDVSDIVQVRTVTKP